MAKAKPKIRTSRKRTVTVDKQEIVDRVIRFYDTDDAARSDEKEIRVQRYAKFRMWTEGSDFPWEDSSDIPLPDLMEKSLHIQDVLHNAVVSFRPAIDAKAARQVNISKEDGVTRLLDVQMFVDQDGEDVIEKLIDAFINDGVYYVLIPWVEDKRDIETIAQYPEVPSEVSPVEYFGQIIKAEYGNVGAQSTNGWDWSLFDENGDLIDEVSFYTDGPGEMVEAVVTREQTIFDGPKVIQKSWEDILYPAHAENLQAPGPSNPHGAGHVILVDYPTINELRALKKSGFYDLLTDQELTRMEKVWGERTKTDAETTEQVKDAIQGTEHPPADKAAKEQRTLTRYTCFDLNAMGKEEAVATDYVYRVIRETKTLLRARKASEDFPSNPQRRPLVHRSFIPVPGRIAGISLLELLEGLHDTSKSIIDQVIDGNTIQIAPPWFYRPSSSVKPEVIRMAPGEGYPIADPSRDIRELQMNSAGAVMGLNLFSLIGQMGDKVTTIGDLQLGRIPSGSSSALRTTGNLALVSSQAEARPQHILRRLFSGIAEIYSHMHGLNLRFLKKEKEIRVIGLPQVSEDPFLKISPIDVTGDFIFTFSANVLNTSKQALQESLQQLFGLWVNPLMIQLGIIQPDGIYRMAKELGKSFGQDPDQFLTRPTPEADEPRITANDAISVILESAIPTGVPAESGGAQEHFMVLRAFLQSELAAGMNKAQMEIFQAYMQQVVQRANAEIQQQRVLQAAQGVQSQGGPQGGAPQSGGSGLENAPLNENELLDETLPGAGGGANAGIA